MSCVTGRVAQVLFALEEKCRCGLWEPSQCFVCRRQWFQRCYSSFLESSVFNGSYTVLETVSKSGDSRSHGGDPPHSTRPLLSGGVRRNLADSCTCGSTTSVTICDTRRRKCYAGALSNFRCRDSEQALRETNYRLGTTPVHLLSRAKGGKLELEVSHPKK